MEKVRKHIITPRNYWRNRDCHHFAGTSLFILNVLLSGDNGLMIGVAALLRSKSQKNIVANGTLKLAKSVSPTLAELRKKKKV